MANLSVSRTVDFLGTLGVNTHLSYTDGAYKNAGTVVSDLQYLGISHVRDSLIDASHLPSYELAASRGITFTFIMGGGSQTTASMNATLGLVQQVAATAQGSVKAVEGPNEINNWPVTYNGVTGLQGALNLQGDLYGAVHGDPALKNVAVDYFTGYDAGSVAAGPDPSTTAGLADYDTQHPYPGGGQAPGAWLDPDRVLDNETAGHEGPFVYTETGYSSNGGTNGSVNQDVQAKYTLDLLFDAKLAGASEVDLYELLDAYPKGSVQGDAGYGLFDTDNSPKLAATAIHNLTSILADNGTNAGTFAPGTITPTLTGLASARDLVMQKSTGAYDIAVWAEPQIWNAASGTEIAAPTTAVTIDLGASYHSVSVFDPLTGTAPIATYTDTRSIVVGISDRPLIIEVTGQSVAPTPLVPSPTIATPSTVTAKAIASASIGTIVSDTASNVVSYLSLLQGNLAKIAEINLSSGSLTVQAGALAADRAALDKVIGGFSVSDSAAALLPLLATLASDTHVTSISVKSGTVDVSVATYLADRAGLDKIGNRFTITDTAANIAAASAQIAGDAAVSAVTTVANGLAVARQTYNADGSLNTSAAISRDVTGNIVDHVTAGSVLNAKSYASYDDVKNAGGKLLSRTTYDAAGSTTGKTVYNANGSVYSNRTISTDSSGNQLSHYTDGSSLNSAGYTSYDVFADKLGKTLYQEQTFGRDTSHVFQVSGSGLSVNANYNDTFAVTGGHDTFVFEHGFGHDMISGFTSGDTIAISKNLFPNYASLMQLVSGTASTTLSDSRGDSLTLLGIAPSHVSPDMFKFF